MFGSVSKDRRTGPRAIASRVIASGAEKATCEPEARGCPQLSHTRMQATWTAARKLVAVFS